MAHFFVNRPIVAMVISIVTVLVGLVAMSGLPIAQYPEVVPPMVQVTTTFVGATATDVEASVATPIEQKVNGVEKGIYMKSTNANDGTLTLKVSFEVGSNLDMDNVLTQNRVSEATPMLPQSVKNYGVAVKKALPFPLLIISIKSPKGTYDNNFLSNYATININDAIARIPGVGQINLFGGSDYAMRVWLRPDRIAKLGLTVPDIVNAINQQNQILPAGQIGGPPAVPGTEYTYTVKTQGRLLNEAEFGNIVVRSNPDGSQVFLKDVARLELGTMLYNSIGRHNGGPAAVIAVFQIPGTNALEVADKIKKTMDELSTRFPRDMEYLDLARHDPPRQGGHQRDRPHAVRGGPPRHPRGLRLPPELAGDAHPARDGAGLADRRVHLLPDARLLDQRPLAPRPRARDRHRGRRRDRRGRGGHAPHRARDGAEGGDAQGHGGGVRPRGRDRPRPLRGVRAGGLHGRHHRALLPAVRDHDRDLGAALGHQRPHPEPGALGPAAEGADGQEDAADALLQLVQQGLRARHRRLRELLGHPDPQDGPQLRLHRHPRRCDRRAGAEHPGGLHPRGGPGLPASPRSTCPTPPRSSAPTR